MVHRHEGAYDGRYKLIHYYDIEEWELYDLQSDPREIRNCYKDLEYANITTEMHIKLDRLRHQYSVPNNERQDVSNVTDQYHSEGQLKRALDRLTKSFLQ